jgi:CO/xanthine dehydrogenase FAD-binding subunit
VSPETLDEAVDLLVRHGDEAKLIAGGQSLVPLLAFRLASPPILIDLNRVAELDYHRMDGDTLVLGALTRHRAVEQMPGLRERCAMLADGVEVIGHVAIRNRGTVGGSLAHSDPAAEWPALALALDGEIDAAGPDGVRTVPASDFFVSYFTTALEPTEIVKEVRLALPGAPAGSAFVELARRHGDFALAGVGALLVLGADGAVADSRVVLIGVKDAPVRSRRAEAVLVGARPTDETLAEAAEAIDEEIEPVSDLHGSSEYRRHLAKVLVRRALAVARARAEGGNGRAG